MGLTGLLVEGLAWLNSNCLLVVLAFVVAKDGTAGLVEGVVGRTGVKRIASGPNDISNQNVIRN